MPKTQTPKHRNYMALNISRGKLSRPQKVVIYAPEGLGKTTLASLLPSPIFFDFEGGTHHVDVARLEPSTLAEFEKWARELVKDKQDFRTVVVDTVDWLEEAVVRQVIADAASDNVKSIEDFGFGKGWVHLGERMNHVLSIFDRLIDAGLHVVCLAHCAVRRFDDPKLASGYDRYELKMYKDRANAKGTAALLKEWADALLFGTFEDKVKPGAADGARGRAVAASGKERVLFCSHSAAWDAKNRHGLKDKEPWSVETLMKVLGNPTPVTPGKPVTPVVGAGGPTKAARSDAGPAVQPTPEAVVVKEKLLRTAAEADAESVAVEETPAADSPGDAVVFVPDLPKSDDPIEGIEEHEEPDEELDRMLTPYAAAVNAYLRDKQVVGPYQSYRSMPEDYRRRVIAAPVKFIERVQAYSAERSAA